jgi:hypothetical protein
MEGLSPGIVFEGLSSFGFRTGIIQNDTVVARFKAVRPIDPALNVEMSVVAGMTLAFVDGPLAGKRVVESLNEIRNYVGIHVIHHLEKFL